ncbi:MAG: M48 family metalloprotease, partial [Gammaproteobacteria bacterium]|nr:M48 family metalloprotease [Gammaproteobacteria bacterium]
MNKTNGRRFTQRIFSILPLLLSLCWSNHGIGDTIALPDIGGSDQTILTPQREREIGEAIMQELRRKHAILEGPEVEAYIQGLGHRLASNSDDPHQRFTFFTVKDYGINAFAAPGGYVGVNAGLILAAETESELAAVLAHEIAHVTQRHITRSYAAMDRLAIPSIAAMA